jgi:GxxExxY protein
MEENQAQINKQKAYYNDFLFKDESFKIRGAVFEVYRDLDCGFLEPVYRACPEKEFSIVGIPYQSKAQLPIFYKGEKIDQIYIPDFICFDSIIVELKAVSELNDEHRAQLHNYLKVSGLKLGLLTNFGHYSKVDIERFVL